MEDQLAIRTKAVNRSWLCPGAGFALIGKRTPAVATFAFSFAILPALAWLAWRPSAWALGLIIGVTAIATSLWLWEQISVRKSSLLPSAPVFLVRGFIAITCAIWVAAVLIAGLFVATYLPLRMAGSGMNSTLAKNEHLVCRRGAARESVKPGAIVVFKNAEDSAWGKPGWIVISRILAGPGDTISLEDGRYVVNGTVGTQAAGTGKYEPVIDIPHRPESITVPENCWFVVQDSTANSFDSQILSWIRTERIVSTELWYFSRRGLFKPVE